MGAEESVQVQCDMRNEGEQSDVESQHKNCTDLMENLQKSVLQGNTDFTLIMEGEDGCINDELPGIESYDFLDDLELCDFVDDGAEFKCGKCDFDMVKSIVTKLSGRRGIRVNVSDVFQTVDGSYRPKFDILDDDFESSESDSDPIDDLDDAYEAVYKKGQRKCKKMKKSKVNRARKELNIKRASSLPPSSQCNQDSKPGKWVISSRSFRKLGLHEVNNNETVRDWVVRSRGPGGVGGVQKNIAFLRAIGAGGARELSLKLVIRNSEKAKESEDITDNRGDSDNEDFVMVK